MWDERVKFIHASEHIYDIFKGGHYWRIFKKNFTIINKFKTKLYDVLFTQIKKANNLHQKEDILTELSKKVIADWHSRLFF